MTDVNAEYKSRFHALTVQLGRPPDTRDSEYWALHEWLRNAYRDGGVTMPEVWKEEERNAKVRSGQGSKNLRGSDVRPNDSIGGMQSRYRDGENSDTDVSTSVEARAIPDRSELASQTRARRFSREPAPQASAMDAREGMDGALSGPGAAEGETGALSEPRAASELPEASQAAQRHCQRCGAGLRDGQGRLRVHTCPERELGLVGSRGPSGGMVARCSACDRLWERPRQRGRPPSVCGECR